MTLTQKWTPQHYQNHIKSNHLDELWYAWCNPSSSNGIRVSAYTPLYNQTNIILSENPCERKNCTGTYKIPEDSNNRKIIYKVECNICKSRKTKLYRWISPYDRTKIYFDNPQTVANYGNFGRTFYSTLILYNKEIISPKEGYINESLMCNCTLAMDIDLKKDTICDYINREELNKTINIIRESLDTFTPKSYNLQTSGNGIYVFLHHLLCKDNIYNTMSMYNGSYIKYLNKICEEKGIRRTKIDGINIPGRVFKMIGSIHQKYDLVCIPLDHDINISRLSADNFKLKNFNINNYFINNKLNFYNRVDEKESAHLYRFLEEHSLESPISGTRAIKHIWSDTITEEDSSQKQVQQKQHKNISDEQFMKHYVGWKHLKLPQGMTGRVIYKNNIDGTKSVEMIGVKSEDEENILDMIWSQ